MVPDVPRNLRATQSPPPWAATRANAALIDVSPATNDLHGEDSSLYVTVPDGFEFDKVAALVTSVTVTDVSGSVKASRIVKVLLGSDVSVALCGHGTNTTIGSRPDAADSGGRSCTRLRSVASASSTTQRTAAGVRARDPERAKRVRT